MKAIVWTKYGSPDGLQLREVAKPTPKDNEVLIKVHAATASTADTELRRLKLPLLFAIPLRLYIGFIKPTRIKILGAEFAGEIVLAGKEVTRYQPGDQVFGYTGLGMGTYVIFRPKLYHPFAAKVYHLRVGKLLKIQYPSGKNTGEIYAQQEQKTYGPTRNTQPIARRR